MKAKVAVPRLLYMSESGNESKFIDEGGIWETLEVDEDRPVDGGYSDPETQWKFLGRASRCGWNICSDEGRDDMV